MFCMNCGGALEDGDIFCGHCGVKISEFVNLVQNVGVVAVQESVPEVSVEVVPESVSEMEEDVISNEDIVPPVLVLVEGGSFTMGSDESEKPAHQVTMDSFYLGMYPVTQKEWMQVMRQNPSSFQGENLPVESITWYDAIKYCNKRSKMEGLTPCYSGEGEAITCNWNADGYRLPTEAEWEYAAKGGKHNSRYKYSGSNVLNEVAWCLDNSENATHPVGTKKANDLGLYDMSGNVREWCWDWFGKYSSEAVINPRGSDFNSARVLRGCCYCDEVNWGRCTQRFFRNPSVKDFRQGFRIARSFTNESVIG